VFFNLVNFARLGILMINHRKSLFSLGLTLTSFANPSHVVAQTTTNCVDIQRILVDACTGGLSEERENEMLQFLIGPTPQNTSNFSVTYGFGQTWFGLVQPNASTALKVIIPLRHCQIRFILFSKTQTFPITPFL
jgi:hypothetical protein